MPRIAILLHELHNQNQKLGVFQMLSLNVVDRRTSVDM